MTHSFSQGILRKYSARLTPRDLVAHAVEDSTLRGSKGAYVIHDRWQSAVSRVYPKRVAFQGNFEKVAISQQPKVRQDRSFRTRDARWLCGFSRNRARNGPPPRGRSVVGRTAARYRRGAWGRVLRRAGLDCGDVTPSDHGESSFPYSVAHPRIRCLVLIPPFRSGSSGHKIVAALARCRASQTHSATDNARRSSSPLSTKTHKPDGGSR
jgi:hypothetical protein